MENLIEVRDIHTFIGQFHILQGVTVQVPKKLTERQKEILRQFEEMTREDKGFFGRKNA